MLFLRALFFSSYGAYPTQPGQGYSQQSSQPTGSRVTVATASLQTLRAMADSYGGSYGQTQNSES